MDRVWEIRGFGVRIVKLNFVDLKIVTIALDVAHG